MIQVEAVVDREWATQGPPVTLREFLAVNEGLNPIHRAQACSMRPGDVLVWNMGAGGVLRLTRLEGGSCE